MNSSIHKNLSGGITSAVETNNSTVVSPGENYFLLSSSNSSNAGLLTALVSYGAADIWLYKIVKFCN